MAAWDNFKQYFPLLQNSDIAYLDNAATSQRPASVIEAEASFSRASNANPLRGFYALSLEATERYEAAREAARRFLNAETTEEILFTKNATEALNLVAYSYALSHLHPGDEILVSIMEHHSNLLPWQMAARVTGARLRFLECATDGSFSPESLDSAFTDKTRLFAVTHVSNVLGRQNPVSSLAQRAHARGAVVVVDAAQSVPHMKVDVRALGADFLAFSAHKMFGPMGLGVLYGKKKLLEDMPPFLTGGEMISSVTREGAVFAELPYKFEAGTQNVAGACGLRAAIEFIENLGFDTIEKREQALTAMAFEGLQRIPHVRVQGSEDPGEHCGILSFLIEGVHPHDVSSILDADGVCIRSGHHCAQPLLQFLGTPATCRASIAFYNTPDDIERFLDSVKSVRRRMGYGE